MNLAAALLTFSNLFVSLSLYGSQTAAQYSSVGRTSVLYAKCLVSCGQPCKFLLRNPSVLLALFFMLSVCLSKRRVLLRVTPRYLWEVVAGMVSPWRE